MRVSPADRLLAEATRRVRADELPAALDALLRGWRLAPHVEFTRRARALGDYLGMILPPITGDNPSHQHEQWLARAATAQPVDHSRLAAGFGRPPMTRIHQRLRWLAGQPADPRWTDHLVDIAVAHALDYWPKLAPSPRRIWALCSKILQTMGDPEAARLLDARMSPPEALEQDPRGARQARDARLRSLADRLRGFTAGAAPDAGLLTDFDAALAQRERRPKPAVEALRRAPANAQSAALLALVYAEPADEDVRRVYADWLEQTGAPRAELMRLQSQQLDAARPSKSVAKRITRLIDRYGTRWLGGLAPYVRDVQWHLGFPNAADVVFRSQAQRDAALDEPAWRTFQEVHVRDAAILHHRNLAGVQQLGRSAPFDSGHLHPKPVDAAVIGGVSQPIMCQRLIIEAFAVAGLKRQRWPALRSVEIIARYGSFNMAPLESFAVEALIFRRIDAAAIPDIVQRFGQTPRLSFTVRGDFRYTLRRDAGRSQLDIIWPARQPCADFSTALAVARSVAPRSIRVLTPSYAQPAPVLRQWRDALAPTPVKLPRARRVRR